MLHYRPFQGVSSVVVLYCLSMTFQSMFVHIICSPVAISFGIKLLTRLTICSLFFYTIEGWIWVLIASVPGLCILFLLLKKGYVHISNRDLRPCYEIVNQTEVEREYRSLAVTTLMDNKINKSSFN